jgi:hypothetical protein
MRAGPARRDSDFRGIDTDALGQLIKQVKDATTAIKGWLNSHPLPPDVPRTGVRMATEVDLWASSQLGMLTRRRNYALTHPDRVHEPPRPGPPQPGGRPPRHTTPSGAGPHLGNFTTQQTAAKAAKSDALAIERAGAEHAAPPDAVWRHLRANADDPDYTAAFFTRLGPAGTAALIAAAHGDRARLDAISAALGTGSHHVPIDEKWLRALLADAGPAHRAEVVRVLRDADLSDKAEAALRRLGELDAPRSQPPAPGSGSVPDSGPGSVPGKADDCSPRAR